MTGLTLPMLAAASDSAARYNGLVMFILILSVFFFVLLMGLMVWFAWKYRKRSDGQRTSPLKHNFKLEFLWSAVPTVLLIVIFAWGFIDFTALSQTPANAVQLRVVAKQWNWTVAYPGLDRECTPEMSADGGAETEFYVPVDRPFTVQLSSDDVLHSFWIPEFKVKKDALPNRYTGFTVTPTKPGRYRMYCAEYCGTNHSRMAGFVNVLSADEWQEWLEGEQCKMDPDAPDYGERLFVKYGCAGCHSVTPERSVKVGPPMYGIATEGVQQIAGEGAVTVDDNYLRESIEYPERRIVDGFAGRNMPAFRGRVTEQELNALIDYIKGLDKAPGGGADDGAGAEDPDPQDPEQPAPEPTE